MEIQDQQRPENNMPICFYKPESTTAAPERSLEELENSFQQKRRMFVEYTRGQFLAENEKCMIHNVPEQLNIATIGYSGHGKSRLGACIDIVTEHPAKGKRYLNIQASSASHGSFEIERFQLMGKSQTFLYDSVGMGDAGESEIRRLTAMVTKKIEGLGKGVTTISPLQTAQGQWSSQVNFIYVVVSAVVKNTQTEDYAELKEAVMVFRELGLPVIGILTHTDLIENKSVSQLIEEFKGKVGIEKMYPVSNKLDETGELSVESKEQLATILADTVVIFESFFVNRVKRQKDTQEIALEMVRPVCSSLYRYCSSIDKNTVLNFLLVVIAALGFVLFLRK